ncbi:MAG: signal peptidase I [Cyanobacteria bacterium REEB65]|nr:signal peptidase I [Cyanobacteria bacterium REEB65]
MNFFRSKGPKSKTRETIETFAVAIGLALVVRSTVAEARYIPSGSMLPTLDIGDRLIIEKITYHLEKPQRDDIVVFNPPPNVPGAQGEAFIKRVIGLPGETVSVHDGTVFVDGKGLVEPYELERPDYEMAPLHLGPDQVFVMGDNRNDSEDSHIWGPLPIQNIIGKAWVRFWPPNRLFVPLTPGGQAH